MLQAIKSFKEERKELKKLGWAQSEEIHVRQFAIKSGVTQANDKLDAIFQRFER